MKKVLCITNYILSFFRNDILVNIPLKKKKKNILVNNKKE